MTDKVICRFHASTGGCRNGVNCRFSHDLSNVPSQVCLYFMAGHCAFGSRCRYAHVHPDGTNLDDDQQSSEGYAAQGEHASGGQQAGEPLPSTGGSQVASHGSDAGGQRGVTAATQPGCADAAWEDEAPGSSVAGPASAAQHGHDSSSHDPIARPRPLSSRGGARDGVDSASDNREHPCADGGHNRCHEHSSSSNPEAEHDLEHGPGQDEWPIGPYTWAEHTAGSHQAPTGVHAGAYEDDERGEAAPSYEEWVAENGFSGEEGWVQHCVEAVLRPEQPGSSVDDPGYPVDDHEYGDGQHRSFDCDSYPDDVENSDDDYQKLLANFAEHYGLEVPPRPEEMRLPSFRDPDSSLEQWKRGEGTPQHTHSQMNGWCGVGRVHAHGGASTPAQCNLPGSSAAARSETHLCAQYCRDGTCSQGASCERLHGIYCKNCQRFALHPSDAQQRSEHAAECLARHRRMSSHVASQLIECCICMELVLSHPEASERKFGLLDCNHAFCLSCIRDWRSRTEGGADVETAVRACPVCRQVTHYVTPSLVWPADEDEKDAIRGAYRNKLASIDCRNFDFGSGTCMFSTSCMYRHAYRNGQLEEGKFRKRVDADGGVGGVRDTRLSEFLDATLRSQQAVRRAIRGVV